MNNLENNRKLATFMGYSYQEYYCISNDGLIVYTNESNHAIFAPHKNWQDLMEIVEKIESEGNQVAIECTWCLIQCFKNSAFKYDVFKDVDTKINAVYQAVVEYVGNKEVKQ